MKKKDTAFSSLFSLRYYPIELPRIVKFNESSLYFRLITSMYQFQILSAFARKRQSLRRANKHHLPHLNLLPQETCWLSKYQGSPDSFFSRLAVATNEHSRQRINVATLSKDFISKHNHKTAHIASSSI
jgi:hypothetical protein